MAAEARRCGAVDPAAIEEVRRALGRALLMLARECAAAEEAGGRTPATPDARPQTAPDRTPDGTTPERRDIVPH